jgi:radical SAM superfamily enzyme YgiQ (UPF0313 family)
MLASMRAAVRNQMFTRANILFGLPGQTRREILESYAFIGRMALIGISDLQLYPFTPYPGSELFEHFVAQGRIRRDAPDYELFLLHLDTGDPSNLQSWSEYFSTRSLFWMTVLGLMFFYSLQFLVRPHRLVSSIARMVRRQPVTWFERTLTVQIRRLLLGTISWHKRPVLQTIVERPQV